MSLGVWQNDPPALWESQRFSHISLSGWWETPQSILLLTLKINNKLQCAHSRVSMSSRRDARGTDLYSSQLDWEILDFMSDPPWRFKNYWLHEMGGFDPMWYLNTGFVWDVLERSVSPPCGHYRNVQNNSWVKMFVCHNKASGDIVKNEIASCN